MIFLKKKKERRRNLIKTWEEDKVAIEALLELRETNFNIQTLRSQVRHVQQNKTRY